MRVLLSALVMGLHDGDDSDGDGDGDEDGDGDGDGRCPKVSVLVFESYAYDVRNLSL
jgi:hypothetical protein